MHFNRINRSFEDQTNTSIYMALQLPTLCCGLFKWLLPPSELRQLLFQIVYCLVKKHEGKPLKISLKKTLRGHYSTNYDFYS